MAGVLGNPIGSKSYYKGDANDLYGSSHNGVYTINGAAGKPTNIPEGVNNGILTVSGGRDEYTTQIITKAVSSEVYIRFYNGASWSPWQRIDNFGYNSLADLSAGVAEQIGFNIQLNLIIQSNGSQTIKFTKAYSGLMFVSSNTAGGYALYYIRGYGVGQTRNIVSPISGNDTSLIAEITYSDSVLGYTINNLREYDLNVMIFQL